MGRVSLVTVLPQHEFVDPVEDLVVRPVLQQRQRGALLLHVQLVVVVPHRVFSFGRVSMAASLAGRASWEVSWAE